jgi:hypothetical protein
MSVLKEEARKIIEDIPENANWDDLIYQFFVSKKLDKAIEEMKDDKLIPHEEVAL